MTKKIYLHCVAALGLASAIYLTPIVKVHANGPVSNGTTTVTRTSSGFTVNAPSSGIDSASVTWNTDTTKISINAENAFYVKTPFTIEVNTTNPLAKSQSINLPIKFTGKIFNTTSEYTFPGLIGQNSGNAYKSSDGNFSYDYFPSTGMLTITALTDAQLTNFRGITYFINNDWIPVPLRAVPYLLDGGVAGNYGAAGSGATVEVSIGNSKTSETVTNTANTFFSSTIVGESNSLISRGSSTVSYTAANATVANGPVINALLNTNMGASKDLLDGSYDHYVCTPVSNAEMVANSNLYRNLRFEHYLPIGSNTSTKVGVKAIAGSSITEEAYKSVFKNLSYDTKTKVFSFDLSRDPKDWKDLADKMLANPPSYPIEWITSYLQRMATGNNATHEAGQIHLYMISSDTYRPINRAFPITIDVKATNSKTNATATQRTIVNPVTAGEGDNTKAGIIVSTVDASGKEIGTKQSPQYFLPTNSYSFTAPQISGYQYQKTNPSNLITQFNIPNILPPTGLITSGQVGNMYNVVFQYAQKAPITYTVVDDTTGQTLVDRAEFCTGIVDEAVDSNENKNKLNQIKNSYISKKYSVGTVLNGLLPAPKDSNGYDIEIHVSHLTSENIVPGKDAETPISDKTATQTVHYAGADDKTPKDDVQKLTFTATVKQTIDDVTGKVIKEETPVWSGTQKSIKVDTPVIAGYTPDKSKVDVNSYQHDGKDTVINVTYKADVSKVKVLYRDVDPLAETSNEIVAQQELVGVTDASFDNEKEYQKRLDVLKAKGYLLVNADAQKGIYPVGEKTLIVDLKHDVKPTENFEVKDVVQTVDYVNEQNEKMADRVSQVFHFANGAAIDQVTKQKLSDNWNEEQSSKQVKSPEIEGYTADKLAIEAATYSHTSEDQSHIVTYKANPQKVTVQFIDVNGLSKSNYKRGTQIPDTAFEIEGKSDETYDNSETIEKEIRTLDVKGYNLITMDAEASIGQYEPKDGDQQVYHVYLNHKKESVKGGRTKSDGSKNPDYNRAVKLTVTYEGAGDQTPVDKVQNFEFESTVTYDQVTDKILDSIWSGPQNSKSVETPKIEGYLANKPVVESLKFDEKSKDVKIVIKYDKPILKTNHSLPVTGEATSKASIVGMLVAAITVFSYLTKRKV